MTCLIPRSPSAPQSGGPFCPQSRAPSATPRSRVGILDLPLGLPASRWDIPPTHPLCGTAATVLGCVIGSRSGSSGLRYPGNT